MNWRNLDGSIELATLGACQVCNTIKALPTHGPSMTEQCFSQKCHGSIRLFEQIVHDPVLNSLVRVLR